jgi:tetratricopeptide (TPR) repeat protein
MASFFSSEDYERRGSELYEQGRYESALKTFRRGLSRFPTVPDLHEGAGGCYLELGEYALAARAFERGLHYAPDSPAMLAGLGSSEVMLGHARSALRCFTAVLALGTEDVGILVLTARNLYEIERFEDSIECCDRALHLDDECAEAYFCKAASLTCLGADLVETEDLFTRALELDSREDMACYYANTLYENRQYRKALQVFESVPTSEMVDAISLERMIKLYRRFKDKQREIARCRRRLTRLLEEKTLEGLMQSVAEEWRRDAAINSSDGRAEG